MSFESEEILLVRFSDHIRHARARGGSRAYLYKIYTKFYPVTFAHATVPSSFDGDTDVRGGGKYIMSLVKLSFYDHFMVARDPSMLSTYRCAFLTTALRGSCRLVTDLFHHTRVGRTL